MSSAKSPRRRAKSQRKKTGRPTVSELILEAASKSPEPGDLSLAALKKTLEDAGYDVENNKTGIYLTIKRMMNSRALFQTKGTGASGSFKLNKKPLSPRRKVVKKKEAKAKRTKRVSPKKAAGGASPAAKKSPKKSKSPAKRPVAAKKPQSPKKAKRRVPEPALTICFGPNKKD